MVLRGAAVARLAVVSRAASMSALGCSVAVLLPLGWLLSRAAKIAHPWLRLVCVAADRLAAVATSVDVIRTLRARCSLKCVDAGEEVCTWPLQSEGS